MNKFLKINEWTIAIDQIAAFSAVDEVSACGEFVTPAHIVVHLKTGRSLNVFTPRPHDEVAAINDMLKDLSS